MNEVDIMVGGSLQEDAAAFVDAWHRIEAGGQVDERRLSFESLEGLLAVLTPKRFEILKHVHRKPAPTIHALAVELCRDYKNVHSDVRALVDAGLLSRSGTHVLADYDMIEARVAL